MTVRVRGSPFDEYIEVLRGVELGSRSKWGVGFRARVRIKVMV